MPPKLPDLSRQNSFAYRRGGVSLLEVLIVIGILALLAVFIIAQCKQSGGKPGGVLMSSATISAARETIKTAAKNFLIASAPVFDCQQAGSLTADVASAQAKINQAARDYPQDYATDKAAIQQDVDAINQQIDLYNFQCGASIPHITLPP